MAFSKTPFMSLAKIVRRCSDCSLVPIPSHAITSHAITSHGSLPPMHCPTIAAHIIRSNRLAKVESTQENAQTDAIPAYSATFSTIPSIYSALWASSGPQSLITCTKCRNSKMMKLKLSQCWKFYPSCCISTRALSWGSLELPVNARINDWNLKLFQHGFYQHYQPKCRGHAQRSGATGECLRCQGHAGGPED